MLLLGISAEMRGIADLRRVADGALARLYAENIIRVSVQTARAVNHRHPARLEWLDKLEQAFLLAVSLDGERREQALAALVPLIERNYPWVKITAVGRLH
ncbi:hypothetical protein [Cypionkella sp.]|uniref:hypothetical protein n=1 Tax=Cypionkella sp. TaxID=2811411 RepID=UPI0026385B0E|nr:hypothetical protein [Cypionkella sp.]